MHHKQLLQSLFEELDELRENGDDYTVRIHAAEEGGFWAEVPALPGCFTQGETMDEVLAMAKDAIEGYLASLVKHDQEIPVEEKQTLVGTLDVQVEAPARA